MDTLSSASGTWRPQGRGRVGGKGRGGEHASRGGKGGRGEARGGPYSGSSTPFGANGSWSHSGAGTSLGDASGQGADPASRAPRAAGAARPPPPPPFGAADAAAAASAEDNNAPVDFQVLIAACPGRGGRLGLAYVDLDQAERVLYVTDVLDPDFEQLGRLRSALLSARGPGAGAQRRQGLVAVPARAPAALMEVAEAPDGALVSGRSTEDGEGGARPLEGGEPFPVTALKPSDFDFEACRQRLLHLRTAGRHDPSEMAAEERELRGQAALDLGNEQLVRAAGGLARFMERHRQSLGDLDEEGQSLHVHDVRLFSLDDMLFVDSQTMSALQVFAEDNGNCKGAGRGSEGASLYGLLEPFTASQAAHATLRRWLQQPSRDKRLLAERHDAVGELSRSRHMELLRELHRELRDVRDLTPIFRRIFGCYHFDNAQDWRNLATSLEHMASALALVRAEAPRAALAPLGDVGQLASDTAAAEEMLHHFIDLEGLGEGGTEVRVRGGVDGQLDAVREQYDSIDEYLTQVAQLERRRLLEEGLDADVADSMAFHYFPQLGFHASVPNPLAEAGVDEDPGAMAELKREAPAPAEGWSYQFAGGGRLFYKCPLATRLDAEIGDLVVAARELELELLLGVAERLRCLEPRLCRAVQLLADLDVLAAFAAAAKQFGWRRPRFSAKTGRLRITKGRHPLVEAGLGSHHSFVPNETEIGLPRRAMADEDPHRDDDVSDTVRIQVVTGANLAGKSVYLKQVGLVVLLAQVGSFVPADDAELGLCDFLFSRIQTCEGATQRCSSFSADVANVSHALRHATSASLLLLDEFGKGTHAADGVAILGATVEHLCRWTHGPKAIVATHFTEVFRFHLVAEDEPGLQLCTMRILPPKGGDESGIAYLYQLVPGVSEGSFGLECARKGGMDAATLARAAEILEALERGDGVPPPAAGPAADAAAKAEAREARRRGACSLLVDRLCSIDPKDADATKELLAFVRSQRTLLRNEAAAAAAASAAGG